MICNGQSIPEIVRGMELAEGNGTWEKRITYLQPKNMLELGTGQGASGACIMRVLPQDSTFTTINYDYPAGYGFGEQLYPWSSDPRLIRIQGDTTDERTVELVRGDVDLMFIDTTHEAHVANLEMRLFQGKLQDGAIVIVDDLSHHDMMAFWESIPYEKIGGDQGIFRYDASKPYVVIIEQAKV